MLRWKNTGLSRLKDLSGKKLLRNSGAYTTLLVAVLAMSFFGVCDRNGGMRAPSGSAAKVGSDSITGNEFRRAYQASYQRLQAQFKDGFDPATFRLAQGVLGQLIDERIIFAEAVKAGMLVSDDEIARLLTDAQAFKDEKGAFSPEAFKNYLRSNRHTEASFQDEIRRSLTVQRFKDFVGQSHFVSDAGLVQQFALSESKIDIDYLKFSAADIKLSVPEGDVAKFEAS
ncbi:MAG: hypothetical protein EBU49_12360, partial [Proteobacteria bacterium]|nr:hypothetical protein [Pseudomonadota bacterium]